MLRAWFLGLDPKLAIRPSSRNSRLLWYCRWLPAGSGLRAVGAPPKVPNMLASYEAPAMVFPEPPFASNTAPVGRVRQLRFSFFARRPGAGRYRGFALSMSMVSTRLFA